MFIAVGHVSLRLKSVISHGDRDWKSLVYRL